MKVLLVHPDDSPVNGVWSRSQWDLVIDLGWAGEAAYREWERKLGCSVRGFYGFGEGPADFRRIAEILSPGLGILVDEHGLDWWEILAPLRIVEMLQAVIVKRVARDADGAELVGTRAHPLAELLGRAVGRGVQWIETRNDSPLTRGLRRFGVAMSRQSPGQILQVVLDKWDMDFRLRARIALTSAPARHAQVLLPSSYSNVTKTLNAYAKLLPESRFLLVTTRKSGAVKVVAANVRSRSLAGFAPTTISESTRKEVRGLEERWATIGEGPLRSNEELGWAKEGGWFREIGRSFEQWLRVRDAWSNVLAREQISAVLCGDENNPMNRIPVLLARERKLPTVHCNHGALNVLLPLRAPACDTYLAMGEMEQDFMERTFSAGSARIEQGAPEVASSSRSPGTAEQSGSIVLFSEQYELTQGRTRIFYEEVLPPLCAIAREHGRRLKVKLHPFESVASRRRIVDAVLQPADREIVDLVKGALTEELLADTWFAVTVESSVSVDCAIRGIPCFLCSWFIAPLVGYGKQFLRYGAARSLESPQDIASIPQLLREFEMTPAVQRKLCNPIEAGRLEKLLQGA